MAHLPNPVVTFVASLLPRLLDPEERLCLQSLSKDGMAKFYKGQANGIPMEQQLADFKEAFRFTQKWWAFGCKNVHARDDDPNVPPPTRLFRKLNEAEANTNEGESEDEDVTMARIESVGKIFDPLPPLTPSPRGSPRRRLAPLERLSVPAMSAEDISSLNGANTLTRIDTPRSGIGGGGGLSPRHPSVQLNLSPHSPTAHGLSPHRSSLAPLPPLQSPHSATTPRSRASSKSSSPRSRRCSRIANDGVGARTTSTISAAALGGLIGSDINKENAADGWLNLIPKSNSIHEDVPESMLPFKSPAPPPPRQLPPTGSSIISKLLNVFSSSSSIPAPSTMRPLSPISPRCRAAQQPQGSSPPTTSPVRAPVSVLTTDSKAFRAGSLSPRNRINGLKQQSEISGVASLPLM